jgi:hypothetical protein
MKTAFTYRTALLAVFVGGLCLSLGFALGQSHQADNPAPVPIIVATPSAPHPQARVLVVDLAAGVIVFDWLDAEGQPVDTGNSIARITVTGDSITPEQRAILAAGITAATAAP